jgi:hypothetical protein
MEVVIGDMRLMWMVSWCFTTYLPYYIMSLFWMGQQSHPQSIRGFKTIPDFVLCHDSRSFWGGRKKDFCCAMFLYGNGFGPFLFTIKTGMMYTFAVSEPKTGNNTISER